ncbi:SDR family oxidoreductase [Salinibacterium sp. ZJ454]|uniref:SDR family oxidoreductase n=1 Tax=Salinibacterium sp. ZJ454 TaxID=2708339 RepID=UPI001420F83C|nr:SDR family oxidoreductase [Salinibacterium sp. ZJ454]
MPKVLIVGASGVVGNAAVEHFLAHNRYEVVALSRRPPEISSLRPFLHIAADLRDGDATKAALADVTDVTHLVFAALTEQPGLISGWSDRAQMELNLAMFRNSLDPLLDAGALRHVTLLQGTKAYGSHLHPIPVPAKERAPRDDHENFYWLQEDYLHEQATNRGIAWTILRPQLVVGRSWGVAMNMIPVLGAYAALCRHEGRPFSFPGGTPYVTEAADARLVAEVIEWAGTSPHAINEYFNVTNGDVFEWRSLWPTIAKTLGVEIGPDEPRSLATMMGESEAAWEAIVARDRLRPIPLTELLGEAHHLSDYIFAHGAVEAPPPGFSSRIKLQQAGFSGCYDTADTFAYWLNDLIGRRVIPGPVENARVGATPLARAAGR